MNAQHHQDLLKLAELCQTPGVHHIRVTHDNSCPAILSQSLDSCNCNPVTTLSNEQEFIVAMVQNREQRRAAAKAARKGNDKGAK